MKRTITPYLFLLFTLVVLYDAYEAVVDLLDYDFSTVAGESWLYRTGLKVGLGARIAMYLGMASFGFYQFWKGAIRPSR